MRRQVKYSYISNFQIGCESNQRKINLLKPNQHLSKIKNFAVFIILEEPEFGIVYQNANKEKCFMGFEEVQKYSDGTLKLIRMRLNNKLEVDKKEKEKME